MVWLVNSRYSSKIEELPQDAMKIHQYTWQEPNGGCHSTYELLYKIRSFSMTLARSNALEELLMFADLHGINSTRLVVMKA